jgi:molecular chaperone GrpE
MTPKDNGQSEETMRVEAEATPISEPSEGSAPADVQLQLQKELAAAKAELQQCQDRFLRKAAEFENFRKRMEREKGDAAVLAKSSVLMEFLPIADACERALESLERRQEAGESLEHYRQGVRLLYKQIHDVFSRIGVVAVSARGQKFDPHYHEAIAREEDPEHEENTVTMELRRGYLFKDRLLRPAQVKVATRPHDKASAEA